MSRVTLLLSCPALLAVTVLLTGCPRSADTNPVTPTSADHADHAEHADQGDHAGPMPPSTEVPEAFAGLSPEDQTLALKQKTCPVSGQALGSMGAPYKVRVKDRDVFLCCQGCEGQILENPDKYLAKLK